MSDGFYVICSHGSLGSLAIEWLPTAGESGYQSTVAMLKCVAEHAAEFSELLLIVQEPDTDNELIEGHGHV